MRSSVVGYTLNSTGRVIYMPMTSTITDNVMFMAISASSTIAGSGMIIVRTIDSTAMGTARSGHGKVLRLWTSPDAAVDEPEAPTVAVRD